MKQFIKEATYYIMKSVFVFFFCASIVVFAAIPLFIANATGNINWCWMELVSLPLTTGISLAIWKHIDL